MIDTKQISDASEDRMLIMKNHMQDVQDGVFLQLQPQLDFLQRTAHDKACQKRLHHNKQKGRRIYPARLSLEGKSASSSAVRASKCPLLRDV